MNNLVWNLIKYALYLGAIGELADATIAMRHEAFKASKHGIISLRVLDRSLIGDTK